MKIWNPRKFHALQYAGWNVSLWDEIQLTHLDVREEALMLKNVDFDWLAIHFPVMINQAVICFLLEFQRVPYIIFPCNISQSIHIIEQVLTELIYQWEFFLFLEGQTAANL